MKRQTKLLLLGGCIVILLVAYSFVSFFFSQEDEPIQEDEMYTVGMISDTSTLSAIEWTLTENTVKLIKTDEKWYVDGKADFPLDTDIVADMIDQIDMVEASYAITDAEELSQYGVDEPPLTVTYTADGQTVTYLFGIENGMTGEYYLMKQDDTAVYLVDYALYEAFDYTLTELALFESIPALSDVTQIDVERANDTFTVVRVDGEDDTVKWTVDGVTVDGAELTEALANLDWLSCAAYVADETEAAQYGFGDSYAHITVSYNVTSEEETGETDEEGNAVTEQVVTPCTFEVLLAADADGNGYGMLPESVLVYTVSAETVKAFTDFAFG